MDIVQKEDGIAVKQDESDLITLELKGEVFVTNPVTYCFRFTNYGGWSNFTVNESTGEFTVNSDWGNWAYRWHTDSLGDGVKLTQFLLKCDADYIVRKLAVEGAHALKDEIDFERTLKAIQERIVEARRAKEITKKDARRLWLMADEFVEDDQCDLNAIDSDLDKLLGNESWEYIAEKHSHRYMFLWKRLIPFFQSWLRNHAQL
jgi:hypothetical protein